MHLIHLLYIRTKLPNLELKTGPEHFLGFYPLGFRGRVN